MKKKLIILFAIMLILSALGAAAIKISDLQKDTMLIQTNKKINIVMTIYPMYLIGLNIAAQNDNIEVNSLIDRNTGCLHDYQLTTQDMKLIASADVLVINGGGMEGFMEDITANYPDLTIIDASQGITMLPTEGEALPGITSLEEEGEYNPHVWLNPQYYIKQIENVRDGLIHYVNSSVKVTNSEASELTKEMRLNSDIYINKINQLDNDIESLKKTLEQKGEHSQGNMQAVIFHDSFAYLANRLGIKVAFSVPLEADTALSAGDIAKIVDEVQKEDIKYLFTEQQYSDSIAKQIEKETNAKVYIIDTVVTGDKAKDSYLNIMKKNLEVLQKSIE